MKTYRLLLLIIISFFIEFNNYAIAQETIAKYKQINNPFGNYKKPVTIAILKFKDSDNLGEDLAMDMLKDPNLITKFNIYPMSVLKENKNVWGLTNFNAENINTQQSLLRNGKISFIVYGTVTDNTGFTMKVINTNDGIIEYECHYENSSNSTAIADAIKFFSNNVKTTYITNGSAIIYVSPSDADIQIDGKPYQSGNTIVLSTGRHEIKIDKPKYHEIRDVINIQSGKIFTKQYELKEQKGFLSLTVNPSDSHVLVEDGDKIIANWKGNVYSKKLETGIYNLKVSKEGYISKSKNITITYDETLTEDISLEYKQSSNIETAKLHFILYGGAALPEGDFSNNSGNKAGFAITGYSTILELSNLGTFISNHFFSTISLSLAVNGMDKSAMEKDASPFKIDAGSYVTTWSMVGLGLDTNPSSSLLNDSNINFYVLGQIGLLLSFFPDITFSYGTESITQTTKIASAFAYGLGAGIVLNNINLRVQYYSGEPKYEQSVSYEGITNTAKVKLPAKVLELLMGINF